MLPITKKVKDGPKTPQAPKSAASSAGLKKKVPVTAANTAKYTDMKKKAAKIAAGPGVTLAKEGTAMRSMQTAAAKAKAEAFKKKYGSYPTEAFMKSYKAKYGKTPN